MRLSFSPQVLNPAQDSIGSCARRLSRNRQSLQQHERASEGQGWRVLWDQSMQPQQPTGLAEACCSPGNLQLGLQVTKDTADPTQVAAAVRTMSSPCQ